MSVHSVVVAVDGESKCGKTTFIDAVANEAIYQDGVIPSLLEPGELERLGFVFPDGVRSELVESLASLQDRVGFNSITRISGGDSFRAATLYVALLGLEGEIKTAFDDSDSDKLRKMLVEDGVIDVLQSDPNIGEQVSHVATMAGVQALCGTIFCDYITNAYNADNGGNLVIIDRRDPVGTMKRHGIIGSATGQVHPGSVVPIYIDTPAESAAVRMKGDYDQNLTIVNERRLVDATRQEFPVTRPTEMIEDFQAWYRQLYIPQTQDRIALPYRLNNDKDVTLDNLQWLGGVVAAGAQDLGIWLTRPDHDGKVSEIRSKLEADPDYAYWTGV